MDGCVRHAARLKPTVKDLFNSVQVSFALFAGNGDVVDVVPVQVRHLHCKAAICHTFLQLECQLALTQSAHYQACKLKPQMEMRLECVLGPWR